MSSLTKSLPSRPEREYTPEEAIHYVKTVGSDLLKLGRTGKPHFRHFTLSDDHTTISWVSPKKKSDDTSVLLRDVKKLLIGQKSSLFERNKIPEYENISFSLIYGEDRSLDLVCKDKREFDIWVTALKELLEGVDSRLGSGNASGRGRAGTANSDGVIDGAVDENAPEGGADLFADQQNSGDVYTWGLGSNGRLGHGETIDCVVPRVTEALLGRNIVLVECGGAHVSAIASNGDCFTWGAGRNGRLGHGHERDRWTALLVAGLRDKRIVDVSCGVYHTAVVTDAGDVYTFGKGSLGRLGYEVTTGSGKQLLPRKVDLHDLKGRVIKVACGYAFTLCLTDKGEVYSFGAGEHGQLGHGACVQSGEPKRIDSLKNTKILKISCGAFHAAAVTDKGRVYTWGQDACGQLGHGGGGDVVEPKIVEFLRKMDVTSVACGDSHSLFLTGGVVYACGDGHYGQLGSGVLEIQNVPDPRAVAGPFIGAVVKDIACGSNHCLALLDDDTVWSWGFGQGGRLGHGDEVDRAFPCQIEALIGKQVRLIACGGAHTAVIVSHGWVPDNESRQCMGCKSLFTFTRRRHHCRYCGGLFCNACANKRVPILAKGLREPVRVCDKCYILLKNQF